MGPEHATAASSRRKAENFSLSQPTNSRRLGKCKKKENGKQKTASIGKPI